VAVDVAHGGDGDVRLARRYDVVGGDVDVRGASGARTTGVSVVGVSCAHFGDAFMVVVDAPGVSCDIHIACATIIEGASGASGARMSVAIIDGVRGACNGVRHGYY
jgi:hypothetical protein